MVSFNRRQEQSTHLDRIVRYIYTYIHIVAVTNHYPSVIYYCSFI